MRLLVHLRVLHPFATVVKYYSVASQASDFENAYRLQEMYPYFLPIQTRWQDNDQYGHVNNIVYHGYFDTLINHYLIRYCGLNANRRTSSLVGFIVSCKCSFHAPMMFPQNPLAALGVERIGRSSVHYRVALFKPRKDQIPLALDYNLLSDGCYSGNPLLAGFETLACTMGKSTHVFVDAVSEKPKEVPEHFRKQLEKILMQPTAAN